MQEEERATREARADEAAASKEATGETSQFYGVHFDSHTSRWRAQVWHSGTAHFIGYFDDEVAAARAVDVRLFANF